MASPSVTYTFSNSTTADATQVNQNFTDLINGMTDGTKDFSISALTVGGSATLNGNVTIGNASGDDLTITASLASSISVKTQATYNVGGATTGLLSVYVAGTSTFTTRIMSAATATWTFTLPVTAGTSGYLLKTDGSGNTSWDIPATSQVSMINVGLAASVGSNNLTIALKQADGSTDATSTAPIKIGFRSSTATSGAYNIRTVTSSLSVLVGNGSTLGHLSGVAAYIYIYAIDNAGTVELAVSSALIDDGSIVSTTTEGGAGAADSQFVIYSTTGRSNVPIRLIGRATSNQASAGAWASAPTELSVTQTRAVVPLPTIQKFTSGSGTYFTPAGAKYIRVRMVGGGGQGGGGGTTAATAGGAGGASTFFNMSAGGGSGGGAAAGNGGTGGAGGTSSLGAGAIGTALTGGLGSAGFAMIVASSNQSGGAGGNSAFGGGAGMGQQAAAGSAGATNTGGGGAGGGSTAGASQFGGGGGGGGGFVDGLIVASLAVSYSYAVGAGGTGAGAAGTGGAAGGAGGSGYVEVTEYYA